jgi:excisionase family DNA binding protein
MLHGSSPGRLITPKDLAAYLQVSRSAVSQWCKGGMIPFIQLGKSVRFDPLKIKVWLEEREQSGGRK